jgi:hypothetical protein
MDWTTKTGGVACNLTVADLQTYFVVAGDDQAPVRDMYSPDAGKASRHEEVSRALMTRCAPFDPSPLMR